MSCIVRRYGDIFFCNKPPGMVMHRGSGHERGLVELLQSYLENPGFTFVNRIDRDTSGLVVGAGSPVVLRNLAALFREHRVKKYYLAMVEGRVEKDSFSHVSYLVREDERVRESNSGRGKEARSNFTVVQRFSDRTLLEARLLTGRTHQLRVQLAGLGHPIIGDARYGRGREQYMLLFSRRLVISSLQVDVSLPIPEYFK
jgi:23S rRNA pseudouridine955/2504/2580 synthase